MATTALAIPVNVDIPGEISREARSASEPSVRKNKGSTGSQDRYFSGKGYFNAGHIVILKA